MPGCPRCKAVRPDCLWEDDVTVVERVTPLSDPVELLVAQLAAMEAWHQALHAAEEHAARPDLSREQRLDAARVLELRRCEQQVLLARTHSTDDQPSPLLGSVPLRAVVAHRHPWTRDTLARALREQGITVLDVVDDGAAAVALAVCEQPALLVVDHVLARRSGADVAAEVGRLAPRTLVAGYVPDEGAVPVLLEAGATTVCTRRVPPAEVAAGLRALVRPVAPEEGNASAHGG